MALVRVELETLVGESGRLDEIAGSMDSRIATARDRTSEFLTSGWSGDAAAAFRTEFELWAEAAGDSVAILRDLVAALRATARDFVQAGTDNNVAIQAVEAPLASLGIASLMSGE